MCVHNYPEIIWVTAAEGETTLRVLKEVPYEWVEMGFLEPLKTGTRWREAAAAFSGGGVWINLLCFVVLEKRDHSAVKTGRDPLPQWKQPEPNPNRFKS